VRPSFYLYDGAGDYGQRCIDLCERTGLARVTCPEAATVALAPRLTRFLPRHEWSAPQLGTLVFHPSILPYHRGPDAIRWTVALGERVSGVTWFWADHGLDTGPICDQEPVLLMPGESPGRAYHTRFIPAGLRSLARAAEGILASRPRRVDQDNAQATYEGFYCSNQSNPALKPANRAQTAAPPPESGKPHTGAAVHGFSRPVTVAHT
jgi:hypothetical protein